MPKTRASASAFDDDEEIGLSSRKVAKKSANAASEPEEASNWDAVVELLNDASMGTDPSEKLDALRKVQERIIFKDADLLDNFLDEVMGFQSDRSQEVRKWVVGFIEEACKKDPELLTRVTANLKMMLYDESVVVRKRVIQAMTFLYKLCLKWICQARVINDKMEAVWAVISEMKNEIVAMVESDNDGIRTHAIKFMEVLVIAQTHLEESVKMGAVKDPFSLDDVPMTLKILRRRKLEEEARSVFDELVKFHGSAHISSANLMTCMSSLTGIAKVRPQMFFSKVITALEMLHANLPPTLAKSQVSSVRKHMKNQLLALLKSGLSTHVENFLVNMTTLLTDLGSSREEITKALPNYDELLRKSRALKKPREEQQSKQKAKRAEIDIPDEDSNSSEDEEGAKSLQESAVDITEKFIIERLDPALVTEMVMRSLPMLPRDVPPQFSNSYTPIDAAGTETQIKHVSRLLAAQMTAVGLGPGVKEIRDKSSTIPLPTVHDSDEEEDSTAAVNSSSLVDSRIAVIGSADLESIGSRRIPGKKSKVQLTPAGVTKKTTSRTRSLKLAEITQPLTSDEKKGLMLRATLRILKSEKSALIGGVVEARSKILSTMGARFPDVAKSALVSYIFADFGKRIDLALSWLYDEYCFYQGFHRNSNLLSRKMDDSEYNIILCTIIRGVIERTDGKERENLTRRLYLESPIITEEAIDLLKSFITVMGSAITVVNLMKDLVIRRPTKKLNCLNFLLEFCSHDLAEVRQTAILTVLQLHAEGDFKNIIEEYAVMYLKFLLSPSPPALLFSVDRGRSQKIGVWMEDTVKVCLYLFLSLLPKNQNLLKSLSEVYTNAKTMVYSEANMGGKPVSVKHTILRELDNPISKVPMNSPGLMALLDNPLPGSETLITRIVHILTDKSMPTPELVEKIKKLYEERVEDVRFLIPVLNGLTKSEIVQCLPKLIHLSNAVVKEVFHRLWSNDKGPMPPAELLIALHNLGNEPAHTKTVVNATKLCFVEKSVYTQEVLAIVLQKLMEQPNLPILFMRTVIQSLAMYPNMVGFITNILQRLITKQVWKQKVIWDGFIKCCEKTIPQSFSVMLQLPPAQLEQFLDEAPHIRDPLLVHVQNFNESQRAHVSARTMKVLYNDYIKGEPKKEDDQEEEAAESVDDAPVEES